ncbi:MAG: hypothetical protein K2X36_01625, partial [Microbacteriaceae bacterium]|nr:hypothetical protein [Microbacteriaceae bacterium]
MIPLSDCSRKPTKILRLSDFLLFPKLKIITIGKKNYDNHNITISTNPEKAEFQHEASALNSPGSEPLNAKLLHHRL